MTKKILGGIVLYNPDIKRLKENIQRATEQLDELVLIDNNSNNILEIEEFVSNNKDISIIRNKKNLGIAKALNQILDFAKSRDYEWSLTLDQDSVLQAGLVEEYKKHFHLENIGMMTCLIKDRNQDNLSLISSKSYDYVERCITSGCLMNIRACLEVGGFDEVMFIDYVDFDMCTSLKRAGYKILRVNFYGLLHELGAKTFHRFLWKKVDTTNHSPIRCYYRARNTIYYMRKHMGFINKKIEIRTIVLRILFITLYEKERPKKLFNIIKGIFEGLMLKLSYDPKSLKNSTDSKS